MIELETQRALYPRVTDIIGKQTAEELRKVPIETLYNASIRGTKVHGYCTAWLNNLWVTDIEEEYKPYFDAFTEWANEYVSECLYSNVRLYDDEKRFTGEFDLIVKMKDGTNCLVDIKTSCSASRSWKVQLAAYSHLCNQNDYHFDTAFILHLKKMAPQKEQSEGKKGSVSSLRVKSKIITLEDINCYWGIFTSALTCYDYFNRKEEKVLCSL